MLRAASRTRARVASEMRAPTIRLSTSETLDWDTPAIAATSVIVGRFLYPAASIGAVAPGRFGRGARGRLDFSAKSSIPPSRLCAAIWLCVAIVIFFYLTD